MPGLRRAFFALITAVLWVSSCRPALAEEELSVSARVDPSEVRQGERLVFEISIAGPVREIPKVEVQGKGYETQPVEVKVLPRVPALPKLEGEVIL